MADMKVFDTLDRLQKDYRDFYGEETGNEHDLRAFAVWLYHREALQKNTPPEQWSRTEWKNPVLHGSIDDQISHIFLDMHKLIKFYIKKALEGTGLATVDDIHFLMRLAATESMTKSEIINSHLSEMSSGTEVIKRLLKKQLIEDFDDPDDGRSKRVRITKAGMKKVTGIASKLHKLHRLFLGMVKEEEKFSLLAIIGKVYAFHSNIFTNERDVTLEELFGKYLDAQPISRAHDPAAGHH